MCVAAIKKKKTCHLDLENIMLSEVSQKMTKTIQSHLYVEPEKKQDRSRPTWNKLMISKG